MTDEMVALARENQRKAGVENVELAHSKRCPAIRQMASFDAKAQSTAFYISMPEVLRRLTSYYENLLIGPGCRLNASFSQ
jgi:hypothetical protein